jgi:hypothetical protein
MRRVFVSSIPFLELNKGQLSSTVSNLNWIIGVDAIFTLSGSLNRVNVMKSEKTGVKCAVSPESSIHSRFLRFEPDPLHIVQWLLEQVLK